MLGLEVVFMFVSLVPCLGYHQEEQHRQKGEYYHSLLKRSIYPL